MTGTVSLLNASPAFPWGSKGHEIVAAIAETQLSGTARKRIKELLPQGTTLAEASTWPDKAGRQIPDMDPYHFINFPKDANAYDQQRDCKLRNCIIEAITWYLQVLKSPNAPRNESALLYGSSHTSSVIYTSHCMPGSPRIEAATVSRCGSLGGKKICTRCGIPVLLSRARQSGRDRGANQSRGKQRRSASMAERTPADWALESLAIVRAQVYRLPVSSEISTAYIEPARAVIRTRLTQAGARLAWMLNETLR